MCSTQFDAIIFDLDGTLWDATDTYLQTWNQAFTELNIPKEIDRSTLEEMIGLEIEQVFHQFFPEFDKPLRIALFEKIEKIQTTLLKASGGVLYAGVKEGINQLAENFPLFLVSNCTTGTLKAFFRHSGLKSKFKDWRVYGQNQQDKSQNLTNITAQYRLKGPVYVGDRRHDYLSSLKAGMAFFQVTYGLDKPLQEDVIKFASFPELVNYLLN